MKRILILIGLVSIVALLILLAMGKRKKGFPVTVDSVSRGSITQIVTGSGKIYPVTEVKISANVAGEIKFLEVEEGDRVRKGQILVRLAQEQYQANLEQAQSGVLSARAGKKLADAEYQRIQNLHKQNLVSDAEFQKAEASLEEAEARLLQSEANLRQAQDALDKTVVRSPIDGVVTRKNKEKGEIALGSQFQADVILVVADLSQLEARVEINENDVPKVALHDTAQITVDAFPDSSIRGEVTQIAHSPVVKGLGTQEEVTNYLVYIRLLHPFTTFRSGMSCTADIQTETHHNVLRVPIQAVTARGMSEEDKKADSESDKIEEVVFLFDDSTSVAKAKKQPVKLGISDDDYYEIISGLKEGDLIITGPFKVLSQKLKDNDPVQKKKTFKRNKK